MVGWLDDYVWLEEKRKPVGYWFYERCVEESRKYHTRAEFKKGCQSAYVIANRNGWLKDFTWLTTKKLWQYEECKELLNIILVLLLKPVINEPMSLLLPISG